MTDLAGYSVSSARWVKPAWLDAWTPTQPPPVPAARISLELNASERALEPAEPAQIIQCLRWLMAAVMGPPISEQSESAVANWWKRVERAYVHGLRDLPPDLLELACDRANQKCKRPPNVAAIRDQVQDEFGERVEARVRLKTADQLARRIETKPAAPTEWQPPTAEDIAHAKETVRLVHEALRTGSKTIKRGSS